MTERYLNKIICGDCLEVMREIPPDSVQCCVTSPPYWGLRDYGVDGQYGLERTPDEYAAKMVEVFRKVRRVLKEDGTLWIVIGDSYTTRSGPTCQPDRLPLPGLKPKDLIGAPWMVAFALRADGWYLRQDIIWHKPGVLPESVKDRCTKSHEYIFLLSKNQHYFCDMQAVEEPATDWGPRHRNGKSESGGTGLAPHRGLSASSRRSTRNKRSVWTVATHPYPEAHFATYPPKLIEPCILAGSRQGDVVLDPFMGAGTTAVVARNLGRRYIGIELNPEYITMAEERIRRETAQLNMFHAARERRNG